MTDYRDFWKSIGIDVEKHDELCEVLPVAFEETYLAQDKRPLGMNYFDAVVSSIHGLRPAELHELREKGKKIVGTFCVFVPDELILAAGAVGVGLCSGSEFWVPEGEKILPKNLCPLIKAFVGADISNTCPFFNCVDMIVGETTCDGKKKAWEIMSEYDDVYVMDLPQMKTERDFKAWVEELYRFKDRLEELTGNKIDAEKLNKAIKLVNRKRKAMYRLYNLRKANPVPISGKDVLLATQIAFFDDPERFINKVNELCDELEEMVDKNEGVFPEDSKRILVTGTPMSIPNWKLHNVIETSGAVAVCEETCTGTRYFENYVEEEHDNLDDQMVALAKRYLDVNCACFTPNDGRTDDIIRLVDEYNADGVIYYNLQFCHTYSVEYELVKKALEEKDIPVLFIETDYSGNDTEQIKTRVQAFVEMLS